MKRAAILLSFLLAGTAAFAQETKAVQEADHYNTTREFKNRLFEVRNRTPRELMPSISLLGSGFKGAAITVNNDLRTLTVRDFPENIAAIEEALGRLDRPAVAEPDIEMKISVLIASKSPLPGAAAIPEDLAPVIKQLQSTLRYAHYGVMTTTVHRTTTGRGIEGSGVADAALLGMTVNQERPVIYRYKVQNIVASSSRERPSIDISLFDFSMNVPIVLGEGNVQYQPVGFQTPVSIREKEKVVIGTSTMGEKAIVVVVTVTRSTPAP